MKKIHIILILVLVTLQSMGQKQYNNFITLTYGLSAISFRDNTTKDLGIDYGEYYGEGSTMNIAFKHNLKNNKFRLCPTFEYGIYYASRGIYNTLKSYETINSFAGIVNLEYDVIRYKSFITTIDAGFGFQSTKTLVFNYGDYVGGISSIIEGGIAFKYAPQDSPIQVILQPLKINYGIDKNRYADKTSMLLGVNIALN